MIRESRIIQKDEIFHLLKQSNITKLEIIRHSNKTLKDKNAISIEIIYNDLDSRPILGRIQAMLEMDKELPFFDLKHREYLYSLLSMHSQKFCKTMSCSDIQVLMGFEKRYRHPIDFNIPKKLKRLINQSAFYQKNQKSII